MSIEHDYFGVIESDRTGALYWSETVEAGDQSVDVSLSAPAGASVDDASLDIAAAVISGLEDLDVSTRESIVGQLGSASSPVTRFVAGVLDEFDGDLEGYVAHDSGDREIDLLRSLELVRAWIHPHRAGEGEAFVTLEFSLDASRSDLVLLVQLTGRGEVVDIEFLE